MVLGCFGGTSLQVSDSPSSPRALLLLSDPPDLFTRHSWRTVPGEARGLCGLGGGDTAHTAESWQQNMSESHEAHGNDVIRKCHSL